MHMTWVNYSMIDSSLYIKYSRSDGWSAKNSALMLSIYYLFMLSCAL